MTREQRDNAICELARKYESELKEKYYEATWMVWQMVRVAVFGPDAYDNPTFDPQEELELHAHRLQVALDERPTIPELLEIWQSAHDVFAALVERQKDLTKRAAMQVQLLACEAQMSALQERLIQVIEAQPSRVEKS